MSLVGVEDRGAVRHLVLQRPEKRNALNGELIQALGAGIEEAAADEGVRILVLRGDGPMFSSGMDLNDLHGLSQEPGGLRDFRQPILAWWNLLEEMPKPTIAQIHGACLGGAFGLALACDSRVMAGEAVAGIMEARVGLLPDVGGCSRLPAVVGVGRAKELIMTGRLVDGREAHRIGFANRTAPAAELEGATAELRNGPLEEAPDLRGFGHPRRIAEGDLLAARLDQPLADPKHPLFGHLALVGAAESHRDDTLAAESLPACTSDHPLEALQRLGDRAIHVRAVVGLGRRQEQVHLLEAVA